MLKTFERSFAAMFFAVSAACAPMLRGQETASAPALTVRPEISIPTDARYTMLKHVSEAAVGRDGRLWLTVQDPDLKQATLDDVKESIAEEFNQHQPHLRAVRPILFEPGGRVWFFFSGPTLRPLGPGGYFFLGYDGRDFIERPLPDNRGNNDFRSSVNGQPPRGSGYADNTAFFVYGGSVYMYGNDKWSSRELLDTARVFPETPIRLFRGAGDADLVAVTGRGDLWHYEKGTWSRLTPPTVDQTGYEPSRSIQEVAANAKGVWVHSAGDLRFISWDAKPPLTPVDLIAQLDAPDFDAREEATNALIAQGGPVVPYLERERPKYEHSDAKYRIEHILNAIRSGAYNQPSHGTDVGDYEITGPVFLHALPDGSAVLGAHTIKARPSTKPGEGASAARTSGAGRTDLGGVLTIDSSGAVSLRGGPELLKLLEGSVSSGNPSPFQPAPNFVSVDHTMHQWVVSEPRGDEATLIDFSTNKVLQHVVTPFDRPPSMAVGDDILLYGMSDFVAVRPAAPDPATPIKPVATVSVDSPRAYVETGDGAVWYLSGRKFYVFDHGKASALPQADDVLPTDAYNLEMIPGKDAIVLQSNQRWVLITRTEKFESDLLENLIQDHRDLFAQSFNGFKHTYDLQQTYIQADTAGNIWLFRQTTHELKVLAGNDWLDATEEMAKVNPRWQIRMAGLFPVGSGGHIYIGEPNNMGQLNSKTAFLGSVEQGKIVLTPTEGFTNENISGHMAFADSKGNLWVNSRTSINSFGMVKITEQGAEPPLTGHLIGVDADDHPWTYDYLTPQHGISQTPLCIWINGVAEPQAQIPFLSPAAAILPMADRRVYLRTDIGLLELHPKGGPSDPEFDTGPLYDLARPSSMSVRGSFPTSTLHVLVNDGTGSSQHLEFFAP